MMNKQLLAQLPFFVYGTLLPEQPNFYLWGDGIASVEDARLDNGRLHNLGNYPMLIEAAGGQVQGKLITVKADAYSKIMQQLDTLEGFDTKNPSDSPYRRVERKVAGANGRLHNAWVYIGQEPYAFGMPLVKSGDWATAVANEIENIQAWWTSVDSVADLTDLTMRHNTPADEWEL